MIAASLSTGLALAAFSFCACTAVETSTPAATLGGHVDFRMTGGIVGMRQSLTIDNYGMAVARDDKRNTEVRRQLDAARIAEIKTAFARIDPRVQSDGTRSACADCFEYVVTAAIDGVYYRARASSDVLQASPYRAVIARLSTTLRETLASDAKGRGSVIPEETR